MAFQQLAVAERVRCVHEAQGKGNRRRKVQLKCRSLLYRFPIDATIGGWTAVPLSCFSFTFPQHQNRLESKGRTPHEQLAVLKLAAVILRRGKAMQAFHAAWRRRRRVRVHVFLQVLCYVHLCKAIASTCFPFPSGFVSLSKGTLDRTDRDR